MISTFHSSQPKVLSMSGASGSYLDSPHWLDRAVNVLDSQMSFNGSTNVTVNARLQIRFDQKQSQACRSKSDNSVVTRKKTKSDSTSFQRLDQSIDLTSSCNLGGKSLLCSLRFFCLETTKDLSDDRVTFKGMTERDAIPDAVTVLQHSSTTKENDYEPLMMFNDDNSSRAKLSGTH
ncbi:hypothetical protein M3Y98_00047500 [Aphelenchoides besseyi]|nr:hypothetical protein M3Y98_00047500 [Aphelenchoides besseyi]KAI6198972.1 hypothetical protein M3Y96_00577300 [Aphelenchoides besseyi]